MIRLDNDIINNDSHNEKVFCQKEILGDMNNNTNIFITKFPPFHFSNNQYLSQNDSHNEKVSCQKKILGDMIISSLVWRGGKPRVMRWMTLDKEPLTKKRSPKALLNNLSHSFEDRKKAQPLQKHYTLRAQEWFYTKFDFISRVTSSASAQ